MLALDLFFFFLSFVVAQHFMRTGTCQFGASCKYHHPRQGGGSVAPVSLSYLGYPLRQVCVLSSLHPHIVLYLLLQAIL